MISSGVKTGPCPIVILSLILKGKDEFNEVVWTMIIHEETISMLNQLVQTCQECESLFRTGSEAVKNQELKFILRSCAEQYRRFAAELIYFTHCPWANPWKGGSADQAHSGRTARKPWPPFPPDQWWDEVAILSSCLRLEEQSIQRFETVLQSGLPTGAHFAVQAQCALLKKAHDRIRWFERGSHSGAAHAGPSNN